ncbi:MAG: DNA mismatch repair endonuclease MutL [Gemmatimonadota bacterium]|nr:DNA mismatch repair endonuclease MutL [Gemmatimonadota bacterium]
MGRINILADNVADQIAAGEVVERPASVVKELVENALDAGARTIEVSLTGGGKTEILVSDDGHGMERDDAVLAVDRHATSKIKTAADLIGVASYGFRGEALPAIASVSRFEMETSADRSAEGTRVVVEGGRMLNVEPAARQPGTSVFVKRLFFNTPARRKFLKSQSAETRACVSAVTILALGRLDVSFKLASDDRVLLDAPSVSSLGDRISTLFGNTIADGLVPVEHHDGMVTVRGFVDRPADAKPSGRKVFFFVNGRPFRDGFLVRSAEAGYRGTIHPGNRPTLFLSLSLSGDAVDVNVHPTKAEVRFRDRRFVERAVEEAVRKALGVVDSAAVTHGYPAEGSAKWDGGSFGTTERGQAWRDSPRHEAQTAALFQEFARSEDADSPQPIEAPVGAVPVSSRDFVQVFNTYIILETPEGVAIIDQHSAHERVIFEQTMAGIEGGGALAQRLLLPITIDLTAEELDAVESNSKTLNAIGFEVEPFGGKSVVIHAVPNPHPRFDARRCFEEMVADLSRGRFGGWSNELERFAATFACRAAVKGGQPLDKQEIRVLLDRLFACELPPHDVHGRPTIVQLRRDDLEKRFGRS